MMDWLEEYWPRLLVGLLAAGIVVMLYAVGEGRRRAAQRRADLCAFLLDGATRADSVTAYTSGRCDPPSAVEEP